jgi:lysophospholipase L1-like esterase
MRRVLLSSILLAACSSGAPPGSGDDDPGADARPAADARDDVTPAPDAAAPDAGPGVAELCFEGLGDPDQPTPDYDQFGPTVGSHCAGTDHQAISGVERVVFLGDSITEGTPPSLPTEYYREVLGWKLRQEWGLLLPISECAAWGARADDLLLPPHEQIHECFDFPVQERTLIVMTVGGNDMNAFLQDAMDGDTPAETMQKVDEMLGQFEDAVRWLKDPANFPNGSFVVFANIYEFTDATGDVESCPGAALAGFSGEAAVQMRPAYVHVDEQYMRIAVETGSDMIFLLESFCGHGFHAGEPENECYRGPDAETWFDLTCIHPNPAGHAAMADLFFQTIME